MNRNEESLQLDDLYINTTQILRKSVFWLKQQIYKLRNFIRDEREKILNLLRTTTDQNNLVLETKLQFLDHVLKKIAKIEQTCEEYRAQLNVDEAEEIEERMIPLPNSSLSKVKKVFEKCNKPIIRREKKPRLCSLRDIGWVNIPSSELDFTGDIITKVKPIPSAFDYSDLKFKQEMISLRLKMFKLPPSSQEKNKAIQDDQTLDGLDFIKTMIKRESFELLSIQNEVTKIHTLKFVNGKLKSAEVWRKFLDAHGNQLQSKWYLVISPQLTKILKKRRVPLVYLHSMKTFNFLLNIPENGINFILNREHLLPLLANKEEAWPWIEKWKLQLKNIRGYDIAATIIQSCWRGFWIRKKLHESECKYIAASVIWHAWLAFKSRCQMHEQYLLKLQTCLVESRNLSLELSKEYDSLIMKPHVVIHLPSMGFLRDIRKTFPVLDFPHYQNTMDLTFSHLRNLNAEVIYVLPVKLTQKLIEGYYDIIASIIPDREVFKDRITFVELPQTKFFQTGSFNVSRSLYFSEQSFKSIKEKIKGKRCFFLPLVMDECDVILSNHYKIPLLGPSMEYQKQLRNKSYFMKMISSLGLSQPPHEINIRDYQTLCIKLAELICLHPEVCSWLIKIDVGTPRHIGTFLVNHLSVPFMPILRRERNNHSEEDWKSCVELREDYLNNLKGFLPGVVSKTIVIPSFYEDWKEFECHLVKYGGVIQAAMKDRFANIVTVSLFIPGSLSGKKPKWTGTADKHVLDAKSGFFVYMMPENTVEIHQIEPTVNKLSTSLQENGYFGYVSFDFYCSRHQLNTKLEVMVIEIHPYYGHAQHFIDWVNFAINGSYNKDQNTIDSNIKLVHEGAGNKRHFKAGKSFESPYWNETMERYAIGIGNLRHSEFSFYRWPRLKTLAENCYIKFNTETKEGYHLIPITGDGNKRMMYTAIGTSMKPTIAKVECHLKNLQKILTRRAEKKKKTVESNLKEAVDFFTKMYLDYENYVLDKCVAEFNPL